MAGPHELRLDRTLAADRAAVQRALTSPSLLATWWGPAGYGVPDLEFDPRPGDAYRITMKPPDGDAFELRGEFREVEPPARLTYTFRWEPPDPDDR